MLFYIISPLPCLTEQEMPMITVLSTTSTPQLDTDEELIRRIRVRLANHLHSLNIQTPRNTVLLLVDAFLAFMELDETTQCGRLSLRNRLRRFKDQALRLEIFEIWLKEPMNATHAVELFIAFKQQIGLVEDTPTGMH